MRAAAKVGLVAAGYVGALVIASVVVVVYVASTSGPDRQTSAAMYDFGDSLLFLAVFVAAALPATAAALFFLRPHRSFWLALCVVVPVVVAGGLPFGASCWCLWGPVVLLWLFFSAQYLLLFYDCWSVCIGRIYFL